jgi:hypothetical protein
MKTVIEQVFGNIDAYDLQIHRLSLDLQDDPEYEALNQGWGIQDGRWYSSRMVRLNLSKYTKQAKPIKGHTVTLFNNDYPLGPIRDVFDKFVSARDFAPLYNIDSDIERVQWLLIHKNEQLVAFTKFINYDGALESQFTAWDYVEPKLSIGVKIVDYEVGVAKSKGFKYLYIGPGYGKSCFYKSKFQGFEWWTGTEWSDDVQAYQDICARDSSINTLEELAKLVWDK